MAKTFTVVPRGLALVIGCNTFPTWNCYPGLFASLVSGNPVIVKPHPGAVLPLAITVQVAREVLAEAGLRPEPGHAGRRGPRPTGWRKVLALRPEVRIVDFTGSNAFGDWLEDNARQASVYTEKAGVNTVVVDSTDSLQGPVPEPGVLVLALHRADVHRAAEHLPPGRRHRHRRGPQGRGGGRRRDRRRRWASCSATTPVPSSCSAAWSTTGCCRPAGGGAAPGGKVLVESRAVAHPSYDQAVVRTPTLVALTVEDREVYEAECFGPVAYLIETADTAESIDTFRRTVIEHGAMTASVYRPRPRWSPTCATRLSTPGWRCRRT